MPQVTDSGKLLPFLPYRKPATTDSRVVLSARRPASDGDGVIANRRSFRRPAAVGRTEQMRKSPAAPGFLVPGMPRRKGECIRPAIRR